jgi:hypothetical protein
MLVFVRRTARSAAEIARPGRLAGFLLGEDLRQQDGDDNRHIVILEQIRSKSNLSKPME